MGIHANDKNFQAGTIIRYRRTGEIGSIVKVIPGETGYSYKIIINGKIHNVPETSIELYEDEEENLLQEFKQGGFGNIEDFKDFQLWYRLSRPLSGDIYSYHSSKTTFNAHQYKPLWRFVSPGSDERLFIADEVGVGKTIEAGLIIKEMIARKRLSSRRPVLVVCPNALVRKWAMEMRDRFNLEMEILDGNALINLFSKIESEGSYPSRYMFSVASMQLLRRKENVEKIRRLSENRADPLFGLVIIDECHHMRNIGTFNNQLGSALSDLAEMMLMLSATPLNLNDSDLFNQLFILNPAAFPDKGAFLALYEPIKSINRLRRLIHEDTTSSRTEIISELNLLKEETLGDLIVQNAGMVEMVERLKISSPLSTEEKVNFDRFLVYLNPLYYSFTRTRKREAIEHQVIRNVMELPVILSEDEMKFQNEALAMLKDLFLARGNEPATLGFMMNIYRRMVSSSIPALRGYMEHSLRCGVMYQQSSDKEDEIEDDSEFEQKPLDPTLAEAFRQLIYDSEKFATNDSKYDQFKVALVKILSSPETPQVLVFSFFVRTLEYLRYRLEKDGISVGVIHGGIPVDSNSGVPDRYQIMDQFKRKKIDVLLSSEVGGEGLDFQYCHALINYDLPYNPMRVEQRIGRIDRFGQKADKITILNMYIKDTVDEEIYDRLYKRIKLAEDGVGAFEPILGQALADAQNQILSGNMTATEKEELSRRLQEAIESAKAEIESYENSRKELLGEELSYQKQTHVEAITPEEALRISQRFLITQSGCKISPLDSKSATMILSPEMVSRVGAYATRGENEGSYYELRSLLNKEKGQYSWKVLFDGNESDSYDDFLLLPPAGSWMRFVAEELKNKNMVKRNFQLKVENAKTGLPSGDYIVFLFEGKIEGNKVETKNLAIPIDLQTGKVVAASYDRLFNLLRLSSDSSGKFVNSIDVDANLELSRAFLLKILEEESKVATNDASYRIDTRLKALNESCNREVENLKRQLTEHETRRLADGQLPNVEYLRMTDARIVKKMDRLNQTKQFLEGRKTATYSHTLEGIIIISCK